MASTALKDIGSSAEALDKAEDLAVTNPYWNPTPIAREAIRALLQRAHDGAPPDEAP